MSKKCTVCDVIGVWCEEKRKTSSNKCTVCNVMGVWCEEKRKASERESRWCVNRTTLVMRIVVFIVL
jgi:hypothetical protein